MDWENILILVIGGAIGIVTNYFSNRYQLQRWREERNEQRKEAKNQLALELLSKDIQIIEDAINNDLTSMQVYNDIRLRKEVGKITEDEMKEEMKQITLDENSKVNLSNDTYIIAEKLAYSLGDEFYKEYRAYQDDTLAQLTYYRNSPTCTMEELELVDSRVYKSAAKVHNLLKEKLLSIRDSA